MTPEAKARVAELLNIIHDAGDEIEKLLEGEIVMMGKGTLSEIHYMITEGLGRDPELFVTPKQLATKLLSE